MITVVRHTVPASGAPAKGAPATDAAGFALALKIAHELHAPTSRAPELATAAAPRAADRRRTARRRAVRA